MKQCQRLKFTGGIDTAEPLQRCDQPATTTVTLTFGAAAVLARDPEDFANTNQAKLCGKCAARLVR